VHNTSRSVSAGLSAELRTSFVHDTSRAPPDTSRDALCTRPSPPTWIKSGQKPERTRSLKVVAVRGTASPVSGRLAPAKSSDRRPGERGTQVMGRVSW
jgi:hypothetical protein